MSHTMSPTQRIFDGALALQGPAREAFLREQCAGDEALRGEVEELLRCDDSPAFLVEAGLAALRQDLAGRDEPLPECLGEYRVLALLGRGGMSVVYRAEQERPRREVALKVLAAGLGGTSGRSRLMLEAEALGRLQHPGIAQVFAAGTFRSTFGEQPFLAMELVRGGTLLQWVHAAPRSLGERIRMIASVADAVHHAHQRGLIHRDLKPANVLVDERGQCKVLDFGIARLLDQDAGHATQTLPGQLLGTLAYMSPEQARGDSASVDVRSDIYSLGVIAYQLLSGVLPIDVSTESIPRGLQRLADEEPKPLGRFDRSLRGDVQTIVGCALRKEPDRRYASMAAFADDLRRVLAREPIQARPATTAYVLVRFLQRHALLLSGVVAVVFGLVVALLASLQAVDRVEAARQLEVAARLDAERKELEARRQEQLKADVLEVLAEVFGASNPRETPGARHQPLAVRLEATMTRLQDRFRSSPETERAVRLALAETLAGRGEFTAARPHLERVLEASPDPRHDVAALQLLAHCQQRQGDQDAAFATLQRLLATTGALAEPLASEIDNLLGQVCWKRGERARAIGLWRAALARVDADPSPATDLAAALRTNLAGALLEDKQIDAAIQMLAPAIQSLGNSVGVEAEETLAAINAHAVALFGQGRFEPAGVLLAQVLKAWTHVFGEDHPERLGILQNYAAVRARLGDVDGAVVAFEQALALGERAYGTEAPELSPVLANFGNLRLQQRRLDEAAALYQRAIDHRLASRPEPDRLLSGYYYDLARIRRDQGDEQAQFQLSQRSLAIRIAALGPCHELVLTRRVEMAWLFARHGRRAEAITELRTIDDALVEVLGGQHRSSIEAARFLATFLLDQDDTAEVPQWIATMLARAAGTPHEAHAKAEAAKLEARLQARPR
jgi:tetratricopeptide (TPR) repeat protein/predicted Ser/Thr protein kinase